MKKRLQKIREIVAAATPRPWRVNGYTGDWDVEADSHNLGGNTDHMFFRQEDAQFVACARNEMPGLLDMAEKMSRTISELDRQLTDALACNAAQADRIENLHAVLESVEWLHDFAESGWPDGLKQCPVCHSSKQSGHLPLCALDKAL